MSVRDDDAHYRFDETAFLAGLGSTTLAPWLDDLVAAVHSRADQLRHGDLPKWRAAMDALPPIVVTGTDLSGSVVTVEGDIASDADQATLRNSLAALIPWRKGPFQLGPVHIDCEWRSDWKWSRLVPHMSPLEGRSVLDVGTGSGYHLWRMRGAGAAVALGIEPGLLFATQFDLFAHYIKDPSVQLLPLTLDALPSPMECFDTVFSMGVLYHRRDHAAHLAELSAALRPGGELVLETLISPSTEDDQLALTGRYARMRNVHAIPSATRVLRWMVDAGFENARLVSTDVTTTDEQRPTPWMPYESLADALDPELNEVTIEGHPRPRRAIFIAHRPTGEPRN